MVGVRVGGAGRPDPGWRPRSTLRPPGWPAEVTAWGRGAAPQDEFGAVVRQPPPTHTGKGALSAVRGRPRVHGMAAGGCGCAGSCACAGAAGVRETTGARGGGLRGAREAVRAPGLRVSGRPRVHGAGGCGVRWRLCVRRGCGCAGDHGYTAGGLRKVAGGCGCAGDLGGRRVRWGLRGARESAGGLHVGGRPQCAGNCGCAHSRAPTAPCLPHRVACGEEGGLRSTTAG